MRWKQMEPWPRNRPQIPTGAAKPAQKIPLSRVVSAGEVVTKAAADLRCAKSSLQSVNLGRRDPATLHRPQSREMQKMRTDSGGSAGKNPGWASRKCILRLNMPKLQPGEPTAAPKDSSSSDNAGISLQKPNYIFFPSLASISATAKPSNPRERYPSPFQPQGLPQARGDLQTSRAYKGFCFGSFRGTSRSANPALQSLQPKYCSTELISGSWHTEPTTGVIRPKK